MGNDPPRKRLNAGCNFFAPLGSWTRIDRADTLHPRRLGHAHEQILIGDDREPAAHDLQQLAGSEQEIRVGRTAVTLVARRESLVDQHPAGRERRQQVRKQRAMQVICNDDPGEGPARIRPGGGFQVGTPCGDPRYPGQPCQPGWRRGRLPRPDGRGPRSSGRDALRPWRRPARRPPREPVRPSGTPRRMAHRNEDGRERRSWPDYMQSGEQLKSYGHEGHKGHDRKTARKRTRRNT